jgi:hypothetical protein
MSGPTLLPQVLVAHRKAGGGPSIASFTTFTRLLQDEDVVPISAPFPALGMCLVIEALLNVSNVVTGVPTYQFQVKLGGVVAWTSDALPTKATASAALPAYLKIMLRFDSIGKTNAAKVVGSGTFTGAAFNPTSGMLQAGSLAVGTGFGSTADDGACNVDFGAVCSASNASNALQLMYYTESLFQY